MKPKHHIHEVIPGERLHRRHPGILADKIAYLESKRLEFFQWFIIDIHEWHELRKKHGRRSRYWKQGAIEEGKNIKILFGYSPHTFVGDVLTHFRGLYCKHYGFKF